MKTPAIEDYCAKLRGVFRYIDSHLQDDLSVDTLSEIAGFSKFHFHRQFTAMVGMAVYKYVQLARFKRASYKLAFRNDTIGEIAMDSGYEAPEAFCRAFKQRIGQTPSEFRTSPQWKSWQEIFDRLSNARMNFMNANILAEQVKLVEMPTTRVAVLEHRGAPVLLGDSIRTFIAWRKSMGLSPSKCATFNIMYDDPFNTEPEDFRFDLAVATDRIIAPNELGVISKVIPGGRCAVLRHIGSDDSFGRSVTCLYGEWLPQSGEEVRDFPLYCQRVAFFPDVPENEAITDIFLPII
ncbi:MAG: AraC family transcriptional regulator [Candidatus Obscuribacterales bacterium]|nr:AraC family transcriptional regulator [Candidatus Obscuribacterales bacterium]